MTICLKYNDVNIFDCLFANNLFVFWKISIEVLPQEQTQWLGGTMALQCFCEKTFFFKA